MPRCSRPAWRSKLKGKTFSLQILLSVAAFRCFLSARMLHALSVIAESPMNVACNIALTEQIWYAKYSQKCLTVTTLTHNIVRTWHTAKNYCMPKRVSVFGGDHP